MLRFFRQIRKQLLNNNRFRKYLVYAIGEIVLVMIGILLALQLNTLKEEGAILKQERNALELIKSNLVREIEDLDRFIEERVIPVSDYLIKAHNKEWNSVNLDSFGLISTTAFNYKSFNTAYEGLKANDKLFIIQNENLKEKIIFYFEQERANLLDWSDWHRNFVYNMMEPYMFNELPINPQEMVVDITFLKKKLEERRLNSIISNQIGSLKRIGETIGGAKELANEIINLIDKEVAIRWLNPTNND